LAFFGLGFFGLGFFGRRAGPAGETLRKRTTKPFPKREKPRNGPFQKEEGRAAAYANRGSGDGIKAEPKTTLAQGDRK
jgi:hypothetical protein